MKTDTERALELIARQLDKLTTEIKLLRKTVERHGIALLPSLSSSDKEDKPAKTEMSDFDIVRSILGD